MWKLRVLQIRNTKVNVPFLQPRRNHGLLSPFDHLRGEIQADYTTLFANPVSRQNDVYPGAASEIHDHLPGLKVRKAGRVAAAP